MVIERRLRSPGFLGRGRDAPLFTGMMYLQWTCPAGWARTIGSYSASRNPIYLDKGKTAGLVFV